MEPEGLISIVVRVIAVAVLVLLNAFFVAAEFSPGEGARHPAPPSPKAKAARLETKRAEKVVKKTPAKKKIPAEKKIAAPKANAMKTKKERAPKTGGKVREKRKSLKR